MLNSVNVHDEILKLTVHNFANCNFLYRSASIPLCTQTVRRAGGVKPIYDAICSLNSLLGFQTVFGSVNFFTDSL